MPYTQDPSVLIQRGASAYGVCENKIQKKLKPNSPKDKKYQSKPLYYGAFLAKGLIERRDKERQKGKVDAIAAYCYILGVFKQYMVKVNAHIQGFKSEHDDYHEISNEVDNISDWVADEEREAEGWAEDFHADAAAAIGKTVDELYGEREARLIQRPRNLYTGLLKPQAPYSEFFGNCLQYLKNIEDANDRLNRLRYVEGAGVIESTVDIEGLDPSAGPFVFDDAAVKDSATLAGTPEIRDDAEVSGAATVSGRALVSGSAQVGDEALVTDDSYVGDNAVVIGGACVYGHSQVCDGAQVYDDAQLHDRVYVGGRAQVGTCKLYNDTIVEGDAEISGGAVIYGGTWDGSEGPVYGGVWRGPGEPL